VKTNIDPEIKIGNGTTKPSKTGRFTRLHLLIVAVLFGGVGTYLLFFSHAATVTANLWVVPSGGSSSCARQATATDFSSAPASAKCSSVSAADAAAQAGDTVRFVAGTYGSFNLTATTKAVTYIGTGSDTVFNSLSLGGVGTAAKADNKTIQSINVRDGGSFMAANHDTVKDSTIAGFTYIESSSDLELNNVDFDGSVAPQSDVIDIYEQDRSYQPNTDIRILYSKIHGGRAETSASHPDGIQFCNCSGTRGDAYHAVNIQIAGNKFYDNECINIRTNPGTGLTFENNVLDNSVTGISGCGYFNADLIGASGSIRYNTFKGGQLIQSNATYSNGLQNWVGNVGAGHSSDCGVKNATWSHNVWTDQKCGTTDKQVADLMLNADGTPKAGSPVIDYGDTANFPTVDANGANRPVGSAPDAGAFEYGATAPSSGCATTLNSGANVATALSSAADGSTVCLNAGNYTWSGTVTKNSMTTVMPASGVTAAQVTLGYADVGASKNITIKGVTVAGGNIATSSSPASHVYFDSDIFTSGLCILTPGNTAMDVLITKSTFANISSPGCGGEGRIQVFGLNVSHTGDNGVTISNNVFGPNGCTDGIQLNGGARGTQILNNEFKGIKEGSCTAHVDPIQFYGGENTLISGNYFHGNSTGIMSGDGNGSPMTVTNNVFDTDGEYPQQVVIGGGSGDKIMHNTFSNNAAVRVGKVNVGFSSNETITDNVLTGGIWFSESQSSAGMTVDYNLISGGGLGAHTINGSPTFVGGASPTTYSGFVLTTSSPGHLGASDGSDIGIITTGSSSGGGGTTDTTKPTVSLTAPTTGATVSGTTSLTATASDNVGVAGVQFKVDGNNVGAEDTTSPYSVSWSSASVANGSHTITAVARDAAGNTQTSTSVSVTVSNAAAPSGTLLLGDQTIESSADSDSPGTAEAFEYTAVASGTAGQIALYLAPDNTATSVKVGLYSNNNGHPGSLLASGTITSPAAGTWNTVSLTNGPNLTAGTSYWIALLGNGGTVTFRNQASGSCSESAATTSLTSLPASWTTGPSWPNCQLSAYVLASSSTGGGTTDTTAPTTSLTAPTNGSSVSGTTTVTASASDAVGVTKVDFYLDGSLVASDTTSPYSFGWTTTASSNGSHNLFTKAYDAAGNVGTSSTVTVTVANTDSTAPSQPTNLTATAQSQTSVALSWSASTDNVGVTSYLIQRNGAVIATVTAPTTSYTDTTAAANTSYSYQVLARDAAGNTSSASTAVSVTTPAAPDTTAPSAPANLTATATAATQVNLSWSAVSDPSGITRYDIYRNGVLLSSSLTTSFADGTVSGNTNYSYTVKAVDGANNTSTASNSATVTTPAPAPPTQTVMVTPTDDTYIAQSTPTANFGNNTQVKSDVSPEQHGLYKFTVNGVGTKRVTSAKLRLYVADGSDDGGKLYRLTSLNWSENTVTYNSRPRVYTGFPISTIGATTAGSWVEVDLTSLITGNGPYGLQLTTPSSNTAGYSSKETANKPQLLLEVR
jgi:hypothetical protein